MSMTPTRTTIQINYADPTGVGNVVTGTESLTSISQFNFLRPNVILDLVSTTAPASLGDGLLSIQRLNGLTTQIASLLQVLPSNQAPNRGGIVPKGVNAGQLQFILEETVTLDAGINVRWTFANPII